jgi:hypothetical protein
MMYYLTTYVAVIFPRFDAAARMKTDLMSELELLQLLAELGEGSFALPDLYTALPKFLDSTLLYYCQLI